MRADAHYVDQLDAPTSIAVQVLALSAVDCDEPQLPVDALVESIKRHGVLEPLIVQKRDRRYRVIAGRKRLAAATAAGLHEVPCIVRRVADDEAQVLAAAARVSAAPTASARPSALAAVDEDLARALAAVLSSTAVLGEGASRLTREVTVDVMRAEGQRALCTLRAAGILRHGVGDGRRFVTPRDVVKRVEDLVTADARLRGITVSAAWANTERLLLNVDAELLSCALGAVTLLMFSALHRVDAASLFLAAAADTPGFVTLSLEQEYVVAPEAWVTLTPASAADGPDGHRLVPLIALRQLVDAYGGKLAISRLPHATRVSVDLPQVPRR